MTRQILEPTSRSSAGIERRLFLRQTLSLGALTLLTGCDISDQDGVQSVLRAMSRWNDRAQAFLFRRQALAPTFAESDVVHDFRYNAFFPGCRCAEAFRRRLPLRIVRIDRGQAALDGRADLRAAAGKPDHAPCLRRGMEHDRQVERAVASATFFSRVGADLTAKYVGFQCADGYYGSIDMATRPASADDHGRQIRRRDPAGQIRLSVQSAHPDQARLQEPEMGDDDLCHQPFSRRVLGGSRLQLVQRVVMPDDDCATGRMRHRCDGQGAAPRPGQDAPHSAVDGEFGLGAKRKLPARHHREHRACRARRGDLRLCRLCARRFRNVV